MEQFNGRLRDIFVTMFIALCAAGEGHAQQEPKRTPIESYYGAVRFALLKCPLTVEIAQMQASSGIRGGSDADGDYQSCIQEGTSQAKGLYPAALKTVKKNSAREALKEHYITALSAINGVNPLLDERLGAYRHRQQLNKTKLDERWTRFEVEQDF